MLPFHEWLLYWNTHFVCGPGFSKVVFAIGGVRRGDGLLEIALVTTRLLSNHCSRSVNVVDLESWCNWPRCGLDHCPTYGQLVFLKLLGLSQLVVDSPRWAFGGCCTAVVVSWAFNRALNSWIQFVREFHCRCWRLLWALGEMDEKIHGRCHVTSPCDNEWTIALWTNAVRAYEEKS